MLLWIVLLFLLACVVVLLVRPFMVENAAGLDATASAAAIYKDQLFEIDDELANGTIDQAQADAARRDIKRRLLMRLPEQETTRRHLAPIERRFLGRAIAGTIALGSLVLYGNLGNPGLPAAPGRANSVAAAAQNGAVPAAPGGFEVTQGQAGSSQFGQGQGQSLPSVEDLIDRMLERLKAAPDDANGWRMLAWSYTGIGRFQEAAGAYDKAIALQPTIAALHTARADALTRAADGKVTVDALAGYEAALRLDPKDGPAHYGRGLARRQSGDDKAALELWLQALAANGPNEGWAAEIEPQVRALANQLGIDITARLSDSGAKTTAGGILGRLAQDATAPASANPPPTAPADRGPTPADIRAADNLSASQRQAMISSMVDGLQQRLEKSPRDAEGWIRLIKSRMVMGDTEQARTALARAIAIFSDSPNEVRQIEAAASEAGVKR